MARRVRIEEEMVGPQISWQVELDLKPGRLDSFKALTNEMVEHARKEPGVLIYQRFIADDQRTVYAYERYVDCQSAVAHLKNFRERFGKRFSDAVQRRQFSVFGNPSADLKAILDGFGAKYFVDFEGFSVL